MVDSSVTYQPSTLPEAARILGVSESTVRRLVKAGKLEAERVLRPQGHVWMVMVPAPSTDPPADPPRWIGASPANPPEQPASPPALAAWMTSVLEPLVVELGTSRQRIEHLARENGRLAAENEALRGSQQPVEAPEATPATEPSIRPSAPWWRAVGRWGPWLLTLAAMGLAIVLMVRLW